MSGSPPAAMRIGALVPLGTVSALSVSLAALIAALAALLTRRGRALSRAGTWDCGYALPTSRMQYSASSFAQLIVTLFHWVLRPRAQRPSIRGLFPAPAQWRSHVDDAVLDRLLVPASQGVERWFGRLRGFQQGLTQHYVLYILITVILMLSALMPVEEVFARFFAR